MTTKEIFAARKVLVALPTYNNEGTLATVIEQIKEYTDALVVVNDGSTDSSQAIIDGAGVDQISYMPNRGKGFAIRSAFKYALEHGFDYVLTIDSDGQHYVSDFDNFATAIEEHPETLIIGARNLQADNMPSKNTFANKFSNFWYAVETGYKLDDTQSGYRLYPICKMSRMKFVSNRYEFEVEVIVRSAWRGIRVMNIPIKVYYPPVEERVSHFKPLKDFTRISILNTFLVSIALVYYYPWRFIRSLTRENIRQFVRNNITHTKDSNFRVAAAMGLGMFFGIIPIWGYQMLVAGVVAHLLKLNKILTLVVSNISVPPMIPFILYGSFYAGALVLGRSINIHLSQISMESVYADLVQYLLGSVVLAVVGAVAMFVLSFIILSIFRRNNGKSVC